MVSMARSEYKRILVVDDESVNRRMLQFLLEKINVHVIEAQSGSEALDKALIEDPDLILMDIMMPDMDGFETCQHLKEKASTSHIPVIFLSALNDIESKNKGFSVGGVDYVSKPFEATELNSRVSAHLALKEHTDILQGRSSHLEEEVRRRTKELEESKTELSRNYAYLQSINELLNLSLQDLGLKDILDRTLDTVLNNSWLITEECGWIFLYDVSKKNFELSSSRNPENHPEPKCSILTESTCACYLGQDQIHINLYNDNNQDDRCTQGPAGMCYIPFYVEGQVLGLLIIRLRPGQVLSSAEHSFLDSISSTLAGIVVRKRASQALKKSENLYRAIFETTQNATCIIQEDGRIELANSAFSALYQLSKDKIERIMDWKDFVHHQDQSMLGMYRKMRMEDPHSAPGSYEFRFVNAHNSVRQVKSTVDQIPGSKRTVVSLLDITAEKHYQAELERRAFYDNLTGLPNRALFRSIVERLLNQQNKRDTSSFALLFLDLDRFSLLNESLGHKAGDIMLKLVAQRLLEAMGSKEAVCRIVSDEFAILLENVQDYSDVVIQAEKIRNLMNTSFDLIDQEVHTTCCIGMVMPSEREGYTCADDVIRDAEIAMHRAKQEGLNAIKAFSPAMHEQTTKFLQIERELHQALKNNEFIVFYQPIIDLPTLTLHGFEALIRWKHPDKGLVPPAEFIPVAEDVDLIIPIGQHVLEKACQQMKSWTNITQQNNLFVSINLSGKQFQEQDVVQTISQAMCQADISASNLKLEITESIIMSDVQTSSKILWQMKDMGIQLAIDDFGTGYSSLSYLQRFPIDYIKIDRSFIWAMEESSQNLELIKAIVAMGHNLEHKLIAEGIESRSQLQLLQDIGCDMGQGFYFAKPMPAPEVSKYLDLYTTQTLLYT